MSAWTNMGEYWSIRGPECEVTLEARPAHCDRGNWIAKLFPKRYSQLDLEIDEADGWPRYFMDVERAKLEVEAWLVKRGQQPLERWPAP